MSLCMYVCVCCVDFVFVCFSVNLLFVFGGGGSSSTNSSSSSI